MNKYNAKKEALRIVSQHRGYRGKISYLKLIRLGLLRAYKEGKADQWINPTTINKNDENIT